MAPPASTNCPDCGREYGWIFGYQCICDQCSRKVCSRCLEFGEICARCRAEAVQRIARRAQLKKQAEQIIVVKSFSVGGHRTIRLLGDISSAEEHRSRGAAEQDLRIQAAELGANAILSCYYRASTGSEPSHSGYGTHYFDLLRAHGRAAIVEPYEKDGEHKQDGTGTRSPRAGLRDKAYYLQVLGLPPDATADDIRQAYRERVKEYHPDRVSHLGQKLRELAEREMKEINEAFEQLRHRRRS